MMFRGYLSLLILAFILPCSAVAGEALVYQGEQTLFENTVWSGDVLIDGILTVAPGIKLEIRPGTRVSFTRFDSNVMVLVNMKFFLRGRFRLLVHLKLRYFSPRQKKNHVQATGGR